MKGIKSKNTGTHNFYGFWTYGKKEVKVVKEVSMRKQVGKLDVLSDVMVW